MKSLKVLLTGTGAPGTRGTIYSLKNNFDNREIKVVCVDMNDNVLGKYIGDSFYTIPPVTRTKDYISSLTKIIDTENIDVLIPQNTAELNVLSKNINSLGNNVKVLISSEKSIQIANNKYLLMKLAGELGLPTPQYQIVNNLDDLKKALKKFGWPREKVVVKPPSSNGSRGVRIIDENFSDNYDFFSSKPNGLLTNFNFLSEHLGTKFAELLVMEYIPGPEYTVDVFNSNQHFMCIPRRRVQIKNGITFEGITEKNEEIISISKTLSNELGLKYCFGFQYKLDKRGKPLLLESNPRVQGTMVLSTFSNANIIYMAVKNLLGEEIKYPSINWGTRLVRYWGALNIQNGKCVGDIAN